jgi:chorismate mutase
MAEMNPEAELARCRARIDDVDLQILELLNQRTLVAQEIGQIKQAASLPVYEPKREDLVYQNVTAHNKGPLPNDAVRRVFERIIDEMRKVQRDRMERNA